MLSDETIRKINENVAYRTMLILEASDRHWKQMFERYPWLVECQARLDARKAAELAQADLQLSLFEPADLAAHRADTEAHRGVYGVRES
ncbi:MAG TPA: hypothetical protein DEB35_05195 [Desulfuromonas sp.]|nr:hypothetical protein [Desulfuromonas sp.]HBT82838.1 hypothetical protein [Desulfuromonas sp.]